MIADDEETPRYCPDCGGPVTLRFCHQTYVADGGGHRPKGIYQQWVRQCQSCHTCHNKGMMRQNWFTYLHMWWFGPALPRTRVQIGFEPWLFDDTHEQREFFRRLLDPNDPFGKAKLRAGRAVNSNTIDNHYH